MLKHMQGTYVQGLSAAKNTETISIIGSVTLHCHPSFSPSYLSTAQDGQFPTLGNCMA